MRKTKFTPEKLPPEIPYTTKEQRRAERDRQLEKQRRIREDRKILRCPNGPHPHPHPEVLNG
ncbi:hypothetical protein [Nocardiopsis sp. NPDC055824]